MSSDTLLQLMEQVCRLYEEVGYSCSDLFGNCRGIGVTRPRAHVAKAPPERPIAMQQPLLIAGANQVLKRHLVISIGRRRDHPQVPPHHPVTELVGTFESLDQTVSELFVLRHLPMSLETLAESRYRIDQSSKVERFDAIRQLCLPSLCKAYSELRTFTFIPPQASPPLSRS